MTVRTAPKVQRKAGQKALRKAPRKDPRKDRAGRGLFPGVNRRGANGAIGGPRWVKAFAAGSPVGYAVGCGVAMAGLLASALPGALRAQERPLVMIDPGHGGAEIGVEHTGILEKDLVLRIGFAIGAEFVERGWDVQYTRTDDRAVEWDDRRGAAEAAGASLLLMLHTNGDEDIEKHGAEVYAYVEDPGSARAADLVSAELRAMGSAVFEDPKPWPFLQSNTVPTVMLELAFLTHPMDRRLLLSETFHHELGEALAAAGDRLLDRP